VNGTKTRIDFFDEERRSSKKSMCENDLKPAAERLPKQPTNNPNPLPSQPLTLTFATQPLTCGNNTKPPLTVTNHKKIYPYHHTTNPKSHNQMPPNK
jgi:hypothetical protein